MVEFGSSPEAVQKVLENASGKVQIGMPTTEIGLMEWIGKPQRTPEERAQGQAVLDGLIKQKRAGAAPTEPGTFSLMEDTEGKPVLVNNKTLEVRPAPGIQSRGTAAKTTEPARAALSYAQDYLKNGAFTGSGDEALQEKFFELAKPTSGFRMTKPQMDMLAQSRGWMGSLKAKARHALNGQWFDDDQRRQIVNTMSDLAKAKLGTGGPPAQTTTQGGWGANPWKK
jgi:hypothetical protein